jgi:hypothetical protein
MFSFNLLSIYNQPNIDKQSVILLGDGFFARGFLHNINHNKFNVLIYQDNNKLYNNII